MKEMSYEQYMENVRSSASIISEECPVRKTLELLNGKWKLILIFFEIAKWGKSI